MFHEITVQRLSVGSIFKLAGIGSFVSLMPFSLLMGVFAFFGADTITWNKEQIYGISALLTSPIIGLMISLVFILLLGSLMALGLWVFSKFRPLTLMVKQSSVGQNG